MEFFQQLAGLSENLELTLRIKRKNDQLTISVMPDTLEDVQPVLITGTPAEMDEGFIKIIRRPLEVMNGLKTNATEAAKEFEAAANKTDAPPADKVKDEGKTAAA